jgi:inner membrane protein involved in colicin E2 resistance
VINPKNLTIEAVFKTEVRRRGIFSVPLFYGTLTLSGSFDPAAAIAGLLPQETISGNHAELVIALSSQKGIQKINASSWGNGEFFSSPATGGTTCSIMDTGGPAAAASTQSCPPSTWMGKRILPSAWRYKAAS